MKARISGKGFDSIFESTKRRSGHHGDIRKSLAMDGLREALESASNSSQDIQAEEIVQREIREAFGKPGTNTQKIGCHPDFRHLEGTNEKEYHHICSLFLDIKNSTRLSFIYSLEDVFVIKNSILKAAAETVRAMDGHVHRFMGDALLAFFGSKALSKDDSIINAINCAAMLESLMVGTIIPSLAEKGFAADYLGFRIGLDFGGDEKVLWASYGLDGVTEVTPTSFHVDVAAKLQNMARRNKAMLGEKIINEIDLPTEYIQKKQVKVNGEIETVEFLDRSYSDANGGRFRYKVWELSHEKYRDLLPYTPELKAGFASSRIIHCPGVEYSCYRTENGREQEYKSVSHALDKNLSLSFKLTLSRIVYEKQSFPLTIILTKRNYGHEAEINRQAGLFRKEPKTITVRDSVITSPFFSGKTITELEITSYRGLHTMEAEIKDSSGIVIFRDIIGVYIK